jgi:hypothetical protein
MASRLVQGYGVAFALATVLAFLLVAGSAFVWIGVPVLGLWLAGRLTTTSEGFLLFVLFTIPLAMVGFGWLLYRLNSLYEAVRGGRQQGRGPRTAWLVSSSDERGRLRRARAPRPLIDVAMTMSAIAAMVLLVVWFFGFAEMNLVSWR